jgi:hypothetical protein
LDVFLDGIQKIANQVDEKQRGNQKYAQVVARKRGLLESQAIS